MKTKILKLVIGIFALLILIIIGGLTYLKIGLPNVGLAPDLSIEGSSEQVKRGEYLAHHMMICMDCHSERDWTQYSGPLVAGTLGQGGEVFDQNMGFPGKYVASNITPFNISKWTDGEIFRAVTSGVSKDGRALFPIMPYHNYGQLDREDILAVISYIRTLSPIDKTNTESFSDFPINFIINTMPTKPNFQSRPSKSDIIAYGKYVSTAAGCYDCHTKQEQGKFTGEAYAGGMRFNLEGFPTIVSTNITPHSSGIGEWSEEQFVERFKMYTDSSFILPKVNPGDKQTVMPWTMYAGMEESDIKAIYAYLNTQKPINTSE